MDARGGELEALDDAGTSYRLTIPPGALPGPTLITVTPLARVDGLPFHAGLEVGARLEPHGLSFLQPATLVITPARPLNPGVQIPWRVEGERQHLDILAAPVPPTPAQVTFVIRHFSDYGSSSATVTERSAESGRPALEAQEQLGRDLAGASGPQEIRGLYQAYGEQILGPLKAAAPQNCMLAALYLQESHSLLIQAELWGVQDEARSILHDVLGTGLAEDVGRRCLKEQFELCLMGGGDVAGLIQWAVRWEQARQGVGLDPRPLALLGGSVLQTALRDYVQRCARYEVELTSTLNYEGSLPAAQGAISLGPTTLKRQISVYSRLPVVAEVSPEATVTLPAATGPLSYTKYEEAGTGSMETVMAAASCEGSALTTRPGTMRAQLNLVFKVGKQPLTSRLQGLSEELQKLVRRLPVMDPLGGAREVDLEHSTVTVHPGEPTEITKTVCHTTGGLFSKEEESDTWRIEWQQRMGPGADQPEGWTLEPLRPAPGVLARLTQHSDGTQNPVAGIKEALWDLRIDLKHTPKR
ncbi:hypothetical protein GCM10010841_27440 [Deinococcus aerophilus]|uniref:Uncharacterized protein n=1 Tax=Deinococcus aerophilus TaxID=522488 RepID=A0ABQ2GYJ3_9DEIO|nr:hypothetical protein GCM10010841_27440 [Deinococcus aerophilus]